MSCMPTGSPFAALPHGTLIAGRPAIFTVTVQISFAYIESGSDSFSPSLNAVSVPVGVSKRSHEENVSENSC